MDQAAQQLGQAEAQLANLQAGGKQTEIDQAEANLADARATLDRAKADLQRNEPLARLRAVSIQEVDQLRAGYRSAEARVHGLEAALAQLRAPLGRDREIAAQRAAVDAARAAVTMAQWRLDQRHVAAPVTGTVNDVLARPGETMSAGAPVVSLLPPENIFVRFFVPEPMLAAVHLSDHVALACDSCPAGLDATISFISPQAEYTPPVIYSESSRAKLVYKVEARPPLQQAPRAQPWPTGRGAANREEWRAMTDVTIDVRDLRKGFGSRKVVDGLTLQVGRGEICGFRGANGSGKTTTIRMLCGLLVPDGGSGTCLGHDIIREASRIRREAGYTTQKFSFYEDLTVFENLDLVARVYDVPNRRESVAGIMDRMRLADRREQLAGQLSGGWKQWLALAACVLHQPMLLLLDEPRAGVDAKARREYPRHGRRGADRPRLDPLHGRGGTLPKNRLSCRGAHRRAGGSGGGLRAFRTRHFRGDGRGFRRGSPAVAARAGSRGGRRVRTRPAYRWDGPRPARKRHPAQRRCLPLLARSRASPRRRIYPYAERERRRIMKAFSFRRFTALLRKEWLQMWRDPITLRFIIALPMMQLFLFAYAINTDPKHLPAGLLSVEHSK
jgi:HlyD family secretion protein